MDTLSKLKETVYIRTFIPDKCKRFIDIRMINIWSSASTGILKSTETYKLRIYVISMDIYRLWGLAVIHSLFSRLKYKYITDIGWLPINFCTHFFTPQETLGITGLFSYVLPSSEHGSDWNLLTSSRSRWDFWKEMCCNFSAEFDLQQSFLGSFIL